MSRTYVIRAVHPSSRSQLERMSGAHCAQGREIPLDVQWRRTRPSWSRNNRQSSFLHRSFDGGRLLGR
eukprot:1232149-Prymnesium_polylepis.1